MARRRNGRADGSHDGGASRILAVVAVVQVAKPFILNREGFVDLEKAAGFESHADMEIRPVAGEQFFGGGLDIRIAECSQQRLERRVELNGLFSHRRPPEST